MTTVACAATLTAGALFLVNPSAAVGAQQWAETPHTKPWDPAVDSVTKESTGWGYFVRARPNAVWPPALPQIQPTRYPHPVFEQLPGAIDDLLAAYDIG